MDYTRVATKCAVVTCLALAGAGCRDNQSHSTGRTVRSAESLYKEGRAVEDRIATSDAQARANLQQARTLYIEALRLNPSTGLEGYIQSALGNVAFYQDDYPTAIEQLTSAYQRVDDPMLKSMILYRKGMAQQRVGQFPQADQTFGQLQQQFPQSEAARLAVAKTGARNFYVQLGVFTQPALADKAVGQLRQQGLTPSKLVDSQGRQVVRVGPMGTYRDAVGVKGRLAGDYPKSLIAP